MSTRRDTFADIMDAFYRVGRDGERKREALRLAENEFKLDASFKGLAFATTRNRTRRLIHIGEQCFSVWRWDEDGVARLNRIVAQGLCGQWIIAAQRADWAADEESRCEPCLAVAREMVAKQAQEELASAADGRTQAVNS